MDIGRCDREDVGPRRGVDCEIPHRLERGTSARKDAGPRREVDLEIPHLLEKGTSASKVAELQGEEVDCDYVGWRGERNIIYKDLKLLPSRRILKTLRRSPKEKAQKGQYLLVVGLDGYIINHLKKRSPL